MLFIPGMQGLSSQTLRMFNNVAIDIAIGLIFIYLVYSLLATAINELVAMVFAYRHRMLEKGIEQMLDGKNYSYYWWDKALNIIRWIFTYPSIQKKFREVTSRTNTAIIEEHDPTKVQVQPLQATLSLKQFLSNKKINTAAPVENGNSPSGQGLLSTPDFYINRAKLNKKAHLFAANITDHPLYRRRSEQSILFKKPAYLESAAFADILMDVLGGSKSQSGTSPVSMDDIEKFISTELTDNPDLKSILNLYIEKAEGDIKRFRGLLENWYDDTMARVSGWYKRQVTKILFLIGVILAMAFKVSTIDIVQKLSADKDARLAMVQTAADYVKRHDISSREPSGDSAAAGKDTSTVAFNDARDKLNSIKALYDESIVQNNSLLGLGWNDYGSANSYLKFKADSAKYLKDSAAYHKSPREYLKSNRNAPVKPLNKKSGVLGKAGFILWETIRAPHNWIGFLLTALAVSLGAPFWFDLLNKFVNIRAGGNDPSEKKKK